MNDHQVILYSLSLLLKSIKNVEVVDVLNDIRKLKAFLFDTRMIGTSVFVVFNQFNDNTDDKQRNSIEEQYLEKENGD